MDILYDIILVITIVSYLLGLFLTHFEKKGIGNIDLASIKFDKASLGNAGFLNVFGMPQEKRKQKVSVSETFQDSRMDSEII